MTAVNRIGWFLLLGLALLALTLALCSRARADSGSLPFPVAAPSSANATRLGGERLTARVAALVPRFGNKGIELVDPGEFASAIVEACNRDVECIARLAAMAIKESGLSAAVARSEYRYHEGDAYTDRYGVRRHRAWGLFQMHRSRLNAEVWGNDDLRVQARTAQRMQAGALAECRAFRGVLPEIGMWRVLSGRGCAARYEGEEARMVMLGHVRRVLK